MATICCDESGNTGEALLDPAQPVFVLASNDYSKEEALSLLEYVRSPQGGEPKFSTLKGTRSGRERLARLFADPRLNESRVIAFLLHKKYMVYTKLVDLIMETLLHDRGVDLYEHGTNIATSNLLYIATPVFCGEQNTENMLQAFVKMMRTRLDEDVDLYFTMGNALIQACTNKEFAETLSPFFRRELLPQWFPYTNKLALDPAIPALFLHIATWGKRKTDRFNVLFDKSKPIASSLPYFRAMLADLGEESKIVEYDRRKFQFPLRALLLEEADSREYPQIQLGDICAGALAHLAARKSADESDELSELIRTMGCHKWLVDGVYPSADVTPEDLGTTGEGGVNPVAPVWERLKPKRG